MWRKSLKKRVNPILILLLFFGFIALVSCMEEQAHENKELRQGLLDAYKSGGKQGLLDFFKKKRSKFTNKFIVNFAKAAVKERKEEWLKAALIIATEKKNERTRAYVLYKTGVYFWSISKNKKALDYFEKALPICEKLNELVGLGDIYRGKGAIYFYNGDFSGALEMYDKALIFYKKTRAPNGQGNVYLGKGDIYQLSGNLSKALEMYDEALFFYKKGGALIGQGNVYSKKGAIYRRYGENTKALELYNKALSFYEKAGNLLGKGNVYQNLGEAYFHSGDNSKALEMFKEALLLHKEIDDPIGQGNVYARIGEVYSKTDENAKALEMLDKAMVFFEEAGFHQGKGNVLLSKGDIYLKTGNSSKALELFEEALTFYKIWEEPVNLGNVYKKMGRLYSVTGDSKKALEMCDKAFVYLNKVRIPTNLGTVYKIKGDIYFADIGNYSKAVQMYKKALYFYDKAGELWGKGNVYSVIGLIHFFNGDNSRALEMCEKAFALYKKIGVVGSKSDTFYLKANVLAKQGKKDEALAIFEKGIANLEKLRMQTPFSEMKRTLMGKFYNRYENIALFMLENNYYDKGFKYAEAMKARVFLDRMSEGLVGLDKGLAPDLKTKRDKLVAKLSLLSKEMHKGSGKEWQKLKKQYHKVESDFEELLIKIRLENPLYAAVRYPQPVPVQTLQKDILKKGEILVRYFITPHKLYVFIISKGNFKVVPLEVKEKEITVIVRRCLLALEENSSREIKKFGKILYRKLFKPLESSVNENNDIIVVPDRELAKIPFESFVIGEKKSGHPVFLLEKYRLKYMQSASILSVLRKHYRRDRGTKSFVGLGDPVYDYNNFKKGLPEQGTLTRSPKRRDEIREIHSSRYARAGGILNRLPMSGQEVKAIAWLFEEKSQKSAVYLREHAKEESAKALEMKDFDFIHFACHGILGKDFQSLVLSQLPLEKSAEDGYFTLNEIMNCDYNARLVVLSACQTGSGKMYRGEGVMGLTRAVMYAGTPAVVASLWDVDDRATKELMTHFYRNMLEKNMDKGEALRQAKLELLKEKKYASPFFWSAFVMYGE